MASERMPNEILMGGVKALSHVLLLVALATAGYCVNAIGQNERDLRAVEKALAATSRDVAVIQGNRFSSADGVALYKQFTEGMRSIEARIAQMPDLSARMERLENKVDRLLDQRGL